MRIATAIALITCLALAGCFEGPAISPGRKAILALKVRPDPLVLPGIAGPL